MTYSQIFISKCGIVKMLLSMILCTSEKNKGIYLLQVKKRLKTTLLKPKIFVSKNDANMKWFPLGLLKSPRD